MLYDSPKILHHGKIAFETLISSQVFDYEIVSNSHIDWWNNDGNYQIVTLLVNRIDGPWLVNLMNTWSNNSVVWWKIGEQIQSGKYVVDFIEKLPF